MVRDRLVPIVFKTIFLIGIVLSTVVIVNNEAYYFWDLFAKNSANLVKIFAIIGYSLFLIGAILEVVSNNKYLNLITILISIGSIVLIAFIRSIFEDNSGLEGTSVSAGPSIVLAITYLLVVVCLCFKKVSFDINLNIRDMVEIAMFSAMAIVLDLTFFKVRIGQNGGSISFAMLPLAFMSVRKGFIKGFIGCGIIFGFLTCIIDGYGIVTYPLDYLGAFGSIAIVGLFKTFKFNRFKLVISEAIMAGLFVVAILCRLAFSTISGMVLYETPFLGSLSYNAAYILPSGGFVLAALLILYKPVSKLFDRKTN